MVNWIKSHKVLTLILVVLGYFGLQMASAIFGVSFLSFQPSRSSSYPYNTVSSPPESFRGFDGASLGESAIVISPSSSGGAPEVPTADRMVVQHSNLSLLVKDVKEAGDRVVGYAQQNGGFMVSSTYNQPQDSPFATITVRVPSEKLSHALDFFRGQSVKVTNENLVGTDVTDQYINIEARLESLERVKVKFEAILDSAEQVQDILTVQRELINTQTQIDNLLGQKKALEDNAGYAKVTVYLSTDELSLPYTPDNKFRPNVVFKLAVRSMLGALQWIAEAAIWVSVYAVVWVPVVIVVVGYKKWQKRKRKNEPTT